MNPFQAIMGRFGASGQAGGQTATPMPGGPFQAANSVIQRAQQLAHSFSNPQNMVQQFFPDAPAEIRNDPNMLVDWLQQSGKVNPQLVQMARQMMGK